MKKLRWISNTYDPERKDWRGHILLRPGQSWAEACADYQIWLTGKIIGEPQVPPDSPHTVEKLKDMHLVGVYIEEEENENSLRNP